MELKVWVDGIQRVICGASYNTTCQDVVIALASAMGRTGRFTLVEKWRDSERPLFPGECPLQALYKWGEYAGEVRFYLVQAATVHVQQKGGQQTWDAQTQNPHVMNKFNPLHLSENRLNSPEAESLRRSSTFSGAHRTDYTPVLSTPAVTSSHQSPSLSSSKSSQQSTVQSSIALARGQPAGIASVPNGEMTGLSSVLMNGSSSQPPSKQLYVPRTTSGGLPSGLQPPVKRDARQLHPANMPATLSSFSPNIKDYPSDSSFKQFMSSKSALVLSDNPPSQNQRYFQHIPSSSASPSAVSSTHHNMLNTTASHSFPSPQLQHSLSSKQSQSKSHLLQQQQQQQQQHLQPTSQFQLLPSSSGHEKIPPNSRPHHQRPQKRERSQDKKAQMSPSATVPSDPQAFSKTMLNNKITETSHMDTTMYGHHYDNAVYSDINITRSINQPGHSDRVPHGLVNSHTSGPQDRAPSKDSLHSHYHNRTDMVKSAIIDRQLAQSKVSDLPNRSYSTGDSSHEFLKHPHEGQAGKLQQQFAVGQQGQGAVGNKFTFVDSAFMKHQKPGIDGYNQRVSSFSSAVAHVRSQGDTSFRSPTAENMDTRQHILSNMKEDSPSERNVQNGIMAVHSTHVVGETNNRTSSSGTQQQYKLHSSQFGYKSPVPFNSISSSQQPSAFTPVSPKPSHETKMSVVYNLNNIDTSSDNNQVHDLSNSSQTSLEIEEYDLDRNFPDVQRRDAAGSGGTKEVHRPSMSAKHYQEDGMALSQSDRDYMQLLRIVSVQQERIKTQEALISEASMEISVLEEEECSKLAQLEMLSEDITHMEKQESQLREELEELERIDWESLQDSEQKREAEINLQMKSLKEGLDKMEWQMKQLSQEADQISKNLKTEEEQINEKKRKNEELEKKIMSEMVCLKDQLASLNKTIDDSGKKLQDVEKHILEAEAQLKQQEEEMNSLTEKLKVQDLTTSGSRSSSPEASSSPAAVLSSDTVGSVNTLSSTDNGEAILKILEDRLSPRSAENGGDGYGNVSSAQHLYKPAMSVKNPNGVWV